MIRFYRAPFSTNVERVALALAHKEIAVESVVIDYSDRSKVERVSGQGLVPVIDDNGTVVVDSMEIVHYSASATPTRRSRPRMSRVAPRCSSFIDWFNQAWKRPPNEIEAELGKSDPDHERIAALAGEMAGALASPRPTAPHFPS